MKLESAFGQKFAEEKDALRIRSFELNGHTFKVKVPLTNEMEAMYERVKTIDEEKAKQYYQELAGEFLNNREKYAKEKDIKYGEHDILVKGVSLKETASNKVLTENRITELFKFLVPESKEFDMNSITYADIDELFPFSVQMELVEEISNVISPTYKGAKGK